MNNKIELLKQAAEALKDNRFIFYDLINEIEEELIDPYKKKLSDDELREIFKRTNTEEPLCEGWPGLERFARAIEKYYLSGD
jgi:hypothetical protein